ncbi:bZIP transcription factor HapX [Arthroderma uncinatum]|uniref:bZIP transcription factor HapX n=1 Tax=Arthroderma uncinatum TaxID=74035 RepID=UPI00144AF57F|nr:bZIP transcription factor HapX [Arthroderma uncinatum]KAF3479474.1 bZIP transcription factor HapX [Arthroderma uncinatum]
MMTTKAGTSTPAPLPLPIAPAAVTHQRSLSVKPLAAAPSPAPLAQCSITSKEWIVPPRPKPGRKPATDTPPTKRKAQNRAAQRAFRERRAARVGELEEHIKKIEEENERDEAALNDTIQSQLQEIEEYKNQILWWKNRCKTLEDEVITEKVAKEDAIKQLQRSSNSERTTAKGHSVIGGCERCSSTRCQCIDDAFNISNITQMQADDTHNKRARSPSQGATQKRYRSNPEIKTEPEELETDFTSSFTIRRHPRGGNDATTPILIDPCGFCQDGSPCICAEMAAEGERNNQPSESNKLPPIQNLSQFTPPPSEGDVLSKSAIIASSKKSNPCANGPGTCAQCMADPRSSVFCKSLAASRASRGQTGGCCGGGSAQGGCCKTRSSSSDTTRQATSSPAITLSCADTFTTLSRHPKFSSATDDLSNWIPQLHTLPNPQDLTPDRRRDQNLTNRPALEVEAASVMGVLRYFDRRFADSK